MNQPRRIDRLRRKQSPIVNHVVDEYLSGRVGRREFVRRATLLGLSVPLIGLLAACGDDDDDATGGTDTVGATTTAGVGPAGGTLKLGIKAPGGAIDPVAAKDVGQLLLLGQVGEFLCWSQADLTLRPVLAESWTPNTDGSVWTFAIRQGVTFNDGSPLRAADVAATIERLADPANESNALSAFSGVLSPTGIATPDEQTVVFTLDAPNGNFPYLVSSDNYNAIILPESYAGSFESSWVGTGPWKLGKFTPDVGVSFVPNDSYWGERPKLDAVEVTFYADEAAMVQALQGNEVDVIHNISADGGAGLEGGFSIIQVPSSAHRQVHMRVDQEPFTDKRTRQAMALLLDRPAIIEGLFLGKGVPGNDSPFAPAFPSTDTSVPQRVKDLAQARQLLEATGQADGFSLTLTGYNVNEIPDYAVLIQNAAREIGVELELSITDTYYDNDWLNSNMGITDYGHRGVPNVFLGAPLLSTGTWNSAHFANPEYDQLVADYVATFDPDAQRSTAKAIQELLLDETPIIFGYFYDYISWTASSVQGVEITAIGQIDLAKATKA